MDFPIYPKIPWYDSSTPFKQCIAFEKYDGTNLALYWNSQDGFQGVYTRRPRKILADDVNFGPAIPIFQQLESTFLEIFSKFEGASDIVVYAEYFGPKSFAGNHYSDDLMQVILLDAWVSSLGFLKPDDFIRNFKGLPLPRIIYRGKITGKFSEEVKNNKFNLNEGVVCKGLDGSWMCKIKTQAWLEKLKNSFQSESWTSNDGITRQIDEELFN